MKKVQGTEAGARPKILETLSGKPSAIPPIWLMRQAGRYLPEYRELRSKAGSFLDLCYNPELASEVTLQPIRRYGFDAAILFSDILVIPHALGQNLRFAEGEGPRLDPVITKQGLASLREQNVCEKLQPVFETVARTRAALDPSKALLGFAGAPWTVATYMLAGGPLKDPASLREHYYNDPEFIEGLLDILIKASVDYLVAQVDAGADALQLFDTWAGGMTPDLTEKLSVIPMLKVARAVKQARPGTPVIVFPKGVGSLAARYVGDAAAEGIGIDFSQDPVWVRNNLSDRAVVQAGPDPLLIVRGGAEMERAIRDYLAAFEGVPYIFNLGHGLVPQTPPQNVARLVEIVRGG